MTDNVVELECVTTLDLPSERVLRRAAEAGLKSVIVIGEREDGSEYFCSSLADGGDVLWRMERAKLRLLRVGDGDER